MIVYGKMIKNIEWQEECSYYLISPLRNGQPIPSGIITLVYFLNHLLHFDNHVFFYLCFLREYFPLNLICFI